MIRVIPIKKYPFLNTQNQLMEYDANSKSFNVKDMVEFSYPHLNQTEDERFETSPNINVVDLGAKMWEVNLSYESFNSDGLTLGDMRNIKFLIFKDMIRNKKYYYFVEDIKQINSKIFRYTLSLDVIKTYWNDIKRFERVKPLRYFPKMKEGYFDYEEKSIENRKQLNITKRDNIILRSKNISSKIMLHHPVKNKINNHISYSFGGMWTYFYMRFSSEDVLYSTDNGHIYMLNRFAFREQDYYIIAYPKTSENENQNSRINRTIYNSLLRSPYLIKAVDSDIPPFNNDFSFNSKIDEVRINYTHDEKTTMRISVSEWDYEYDRVMNFYEDSEYLKIVQGNYLTKSLRDYLSEKYIDTNIAYFLLLKDNNPNNTTLTNLLIPFNDIYDGKTWNQLTLTDKSKIDFPAFLYFVDIRSIGENNPSLTNALYQDLEIGYNNSNKIPVRLFDSTIREYYGTLEINYTSFIKHDLFNTEEIIRSVNNKKSFEEYTKRNTELRNTGVRDDFQNYLLLNNNSLAQKEKQLYRFNDVKDIVSGGLSVASAITTANPLAIVGSSYILTKNLFENAERRKMYEAEMEDRKLAPIQYEVGNFNSNDTIFSYFPVLVRYGFSSAINTDFTKFNTYGMDDNRNINSIKEYGYLTLGEIKDMKDLFTRRFYNFIQIVEGDSMSIFTALDTIPNSHLEMIIEIFENGVRFFTTTAILGGGIYTLTNYEIE